MTLACRGTFDSSWLTKIVFGQTAVRFLKTRRSSARCVHRGFAFVTFATKDAGAQAISYWDKQEFMGRTMQVRHYLGSSTTWMGWEEAEECGSCAGELRQAQGVGPTPWPTSGYVHRQLHVLKRMVPQGLAEFH